MRSSSGCMSPRMDRRLSGSSAYRPTSFCAPRQPFDVEQHHGLLSIGRLSDVGKDDPNLGGKRPRLPFSRTPACDTRRKAPLDH